VQYFKSCPQLQLAHYEENEKIKDPHSQGKKNSALRFLLQLGIRVFADTDNTKNQTNDGKQESANDCAGYHTGCFCGLCFLGEAEGVPLTGQPHPTQITASSINSFPHFEQYFIMITSLNLFWNFQTYNMTIRHNCQVEI